MKDDCLDKLINIYNDLGKAEKRVADYIIRNKSEVIHLSITEIAHRCKSGEATVVRVCKKLGCKGYQELKIKIASEIVNPLDDICEDINEDDDVLIMMQKIINSNIYSLDKTLELANVEEMQKAIDIAFLSKNISFFGMGGSAAVAMDACHKFLRTGKRCEFHNDSHMQAMISSIYTENDCIIAVSNSGSNKELVENIRIAKCNSVSIISVTSNKLSPLSEISDAILLSYGIEQKIKSEAMSSRLSALSLLDCLYVGVCLKDRDAYLKNISKIRNAIAFKRY